MHCSVLIRGVVWSKKKLKCENLEIWNDVYHLVYHEVQPMHLLLYSLSPESGDLVVWLGTISGERIWHITRPLTARRDKKHPYFGGEHGFTAQTHSCLSFCWVLQLYLCISALVLLPPLWDFAYQTPLTFLAVLLGFSNPFFDLQYIFLSWVLASLLSRFQFYFLIWNLPTVWLFVLGLLHRHIKFYIKPWILQSICLLIHWLLIVNTLRAWMCISSCSDPHLEPLLITETMDPGTSFKLRSAPDLSYTVVGSVFSSVFSAISPRCPLGWCCRLVCSSWISSRGSNALDKIPAGCAPASVVMTQKLWEVK